MTSLHTHTRNPYCYYLPGAVQHGEAEARGEGGEVVGAHPQGEARGGRRDVQGAGLGEAQG